MLSLNPFVSGLTIVSACSLLGVSAHAATISYPDFTGATGLTFNDNGASQSPAVVGGALQLTQNGAGSGVTSVWVTDSVQLGPGNAFEAWFSFSVISEGDGLVFALQSDPDGANALGGGGSSMGINGVDPYVAVIIDSFSDHNKDLRIDTTGATVQATADVDRHLYQDTNADGSGETAYLWVDYDGTTLSVFFSDTNVKPASSVMSADIDLAALLGDSAFVGFTSATGGADATHRVNAFEFTVIPEPATLALLAFGGALLLPRKAARAAGTR